METVPRLLSQATNKRANRRDVSAFRSLLHQRRRPPAFRPLPPTPRQPLIRAAAVAAGAGSTPERRSCLRGEIKGPYRSARCHAFCMRKTLSKRRLGPKKRRKKRRRSWRDVLKPEKQPDVQLSRFDEPSSPAAIPGFSCPSSSPSSSSPPSAPAFFCPESQDVKNKKKKKGKKEKLAAGVCLMVAASPLENSGVACELFRKCGESAAHEATPPGNRRQRRGPETAAHPTLV